MVHVCGEKGLAVDFVLGHRDEAEVNLRMKCGFEIEVDPTERSVSMDSRLVHRLSTSLFYSTQVSLFSMSTRPPLNIRT